MNLETYSIQGVEVFSVGKWNGDPYTLEDLKDMINAFEETKQGIPPYLKLGHDDNQNLVQNDGMPAAGWISRLYIKGEKLVADFIDIPKKIFQLISSKAYRKVSSEIYWNIKIGDKTYKRLLGAVSLLGSDMPAVSNLKDILSMYKLLGENQPKVYTENVINLEIKNYKINEGLNMPTELELKLEQESQVAKDEAKKYKADLEKIEKENEDLKKYKAEFEAKEALLLREKKQAQDELFFNSLLSEKLATPSMKPYILEILGEDKKEYSLKVNENDIKLNKENLIKETLKLFKSATAVNIDESSVSGDKNSLSVNEKELHSKITKYAADNKMTYGQAAKIVLKEKQ